MAVPPVTRAYLSLCFLTTAGCALDVISPFSVYFNSSLILYRLQLWRLVTNFFFFGSLGLDFVFHMFFLARYCRMLEEGSFRNRTADFFWMLVVGAVLLLCAAPLVNIQFLGSSLTFMMVYVWGRRNAHVQMSFLGLFTFSAPYLPWVLLLFSSMLGASPLVDALGMGAGHVYYYLEDVYPRLSERKDARGQVIRPGRRLLATPGMIKALFPPQDGFPTIVLAPARDEGAGEAMGAGVVEAVGDERGHREEEAPAADEGTWGRGQAGGGLADGEAGEAHVHQD